MMRFFRSTMVLGLALVLFQSGCQTTSTGPDVGDTGFLAYEGEQREWPTSQSALVERDWPLPVYREFPARPYRVLGRVIGTQQHVVGRAFAQGLWSDRDRLRNVCAQAQLRGADAVLLTRDPELMELFGVSSVDAADSPLFDFAGAVLAIQWAD